MAVDILGDHDYELSIVVSAPDIRAKALNQVVEFFFAEEVIQTHTLDLHRLKYR